MVGRCIVLHIHYRILTCKLTMTRKQVILHIFWHKTYICGFINEAQKQLLRELLETSIHRQPRG